jgi:hypothetical protein
VIEKVRETQRERERERECKRVRGRGEERGKRGDSRQLFSIHLGFYFTKTGGVRSLWPNFGEFLFEKGKNRGKSNKCKFEQNHLTLKTATKNL